MKFIGNKLRLLNFIDEAVKKTKIKKGTFIDLFSGTTNVAQHYKKKGFKIISNDILNFSYVFQYAYIKVNKLPKFKNLKLNGKKIKKIKEVIDHLNKLKGKKGFIYKNYCEGGTKNKKYQRRYFSNENAIKIDAIRSKIQQWLKEEKINKEEFYILLAELIDRSDFIANNSGTYGAFLKIWRSMALKPLKLNIPKIINSKIKQEINKKDVLELIKEIKGDILYLDPPYNTRQYSANYHILETIALYDNPKILGKTGLRKDYFKSDFSSKIKVRKAFMKLIKNAKVKFIIMSYNNEGIIPRDLIIKTLEKKGRLFMLEKDYRRFRSESDHVKRQYKKCDDKTKEYIYLCKVL